MRKANIERYKDVIANIRRPSRYLGNERNIIKETQRQGIELRKSKGLYVGRKTGTTDNREKTLTKHKDIVLLLEKKVKTTDIVNLTGKTRPTIYKVKKML